jgi:pyrimidine operon attenuation protein/uracil phosphoribosyltransferase
MPTILSGSDLQRALKRIAHEILEKNRGSDSIVLLGIPTRGATLSQRLAQLISTLENSKIDQGTLDITMYRDDLSRQAPRALLPTVIPTSGIDGKNVILVDDVLFSGRTIRAALDAISEFGRPKTVQLAVLIDRGHRELPIRADYVGKNIPTSRSERVQVCLTESDGIDEVRIEEIL